MTTLDQNKLYKKQLETSIALALKEDAPNGDITSTLCLEPTQLGEATLFAKEKGIFFGNDIFSYLNNQFSLKGECIADSSPFNKGDVLASLSGSLSDILQLERVLLNFVAHLSGIATKTNTYVNALNNKNIALCDTRKTTPGLRYLEKAAVAAGGGLNHRFSLSDMILIKENHLDSLAKQHSNATFVLEEKLKVFKKKQPEILIQLEIRDLDALKTLPITCCDLLLLDNFSIDQLNRAIHWLKEANYKGQLEVSGNITLEKLSLYQDKAIHRISVGALTHSVKSLDLSLLID